MATPTTNPTANGALRIDASCENPISPIDNAITTQHYVLVGQTFHICINALFPGTSASGYQARVHWTEEFLSLTPRTSSVNGVWEDLIPALGGPPNGANPSQALGPADDNAGDDAYIQIEASDDADQNSSPAYTGPVAQLEFTCQAHGNALIEMRGPGGGGSSYLLDSGVPIKVTLVAAFVKCLTPELDSDVDGCTNAQELGSDQMDGGLRNPMRFWDVFDTPTGANGAKDRAVSGSDFFAILGRFGSEGNPAIDPLSLPPPAPTYHTAYDRDASSGPNPWNLTAANGSIAGTDFFAVLGQFGLNCN
jgi:hypothetical protein